MRAEDLPAAVAAAACDALFRCCDESGRRARLGTLITNPRVPEEVRERAPGRTQSECRAVMTALYRVAPFGDWIDAVARGEADYVPDGARRCFEEMASAGCGRALGSLFDTRCFGYIDSHHMGRRMFAPTVRVGRPCRFIVEQVYPSPVVNTCDRETGVCCMPDPRDPDRCLNPIAARVRGITEGVCRRAAQLGEPCDEVRESSGPRRCGMKYLCGGLSRRCVMHDLVTPLAVGDACFDRLEGVFRGLCPEGSACDSYRPFAPGLALTSLPTDRCLAYIPVGGACERPGECASYRCEDGRCAPSAIDSACSLD